MPYPDSSFQISMAFSHNRFPNNAAKIAIKVAPIIVPKKWLNYGAPSCPFHGTKMDEIGNWDEE